MTFSIIAHLVSKVKSDFRLFRVLILVSGGKEFVDAQLPVSC